MQPTEYINAYKQKAHHQGNKQIIDKIKFKRRKIDIEWEKKGMECDFVCTKRVNFWLLLFIID